MDEWQKNGGYVTSAREVLEVIADFEFQTNSKFSVFRQENLYGKENLDFKKISKFEVRWIDSQANALPHISFDGVPFIILGKKKWDCQGKQRNKKNIEKNKQKRLNKEDHDFKRRKKEVQTSKKLACPLQIRVRHIVKFPDFKIESIVADDKHKREALSKSLKRALEETQDFTIQHRYYVLLPNEEHQNHLIGEAGCLVQPVGETVKKFIHSTVFEQNVTSTKEMRLLVEMHVRQHFNGTTLPPKTNKRFWPSIKDLQNHIAFALRKQRNSTLDQAVVKDLVKKWQEENAKDSFFLRLKEDVDEGNDHHDYFWSNIKNKEASDLLQEAKQTHQLTLDDSSLVGSAVMELFCKEEAAEAYISLTKTFPKSLDGSQKYRLLNLILAKLVESKVIILPKDPSKNPLLRKNLINEAMEDLLKAVEGDSLSKTKKVTWSDGFETDDTCIDIDEQKARNKVNKIWDSDLASKYFIAKVYGTVVTYGDISSLKNGEWLTDKVMDAYLGYIAQVEMDRGRLKVRREVVSTVNNIVNGKYVPGRHERNKIMPYDFIIGAYHQRGGHWDLLIIEPPKARVVFLNPMGETLYQTRTVLLNWRKYIGQILVLHPEDNITRNWTLHTPDHSKQQDGSSCGIFCLMFAEKYIQGEALEGITQTRANFKRREVANTLLLFEGHMDGCCPCCGFNTRQGQEPLVKCRMCAKYFHMKNHCVGNITSEDATFICEICSRS